MADNHNDDASNADDEETTFVETKIERLQSDNPKERLFSITFDNFEDLPSEKGHEVYSSKFSCFGAQWRVEIFPGGSIFSSKGMIALFLDRRSEGRKLPMKYSFAVDSKEGEHQIIRRGKHTFDESGDDAWGCNNFCLREELIECGFAYLEEGALKIRVGIQLDDFIPRNPTSSIILKMFNDEKTADLVFEICEQHKCESKSDRKRAKTSTAKLYHAHRCILQHHSPELSALCATSDDKTPIIITDVKSEVFRHLLYYVYGGEITEDDFVGHERDLICAADKYGVTNLKLEAEVWYVNNTEITIDNVIDNLLYAHAKNCALLKEKVMDFIVENKKTVMQRKQVSFQDVPGDVFKELLAAMLRYEEENDSSSDDDDDDDDDGNETDAEKTYSIMRICDLRRKLGDKGLDIDGSREALIAKLKENS